jgi:hypothetical protein
MSVQQDHDNTHLTLSMLYMSASLSEDRFNNLLSGVPHVAARVGTEKLDVDYCLTRHRRGTKQIVIGHMQSGILR